MCALTAGQRGKRVLVIEHANRVGKKILMSGGGRCNFTNTGATPANYLSANPHFCKSALARYTPRHFIEMVERHGIAYHEKELGQLFCDVSSKLIVKMLLDECACRRRARRDQLQHRTRGAWRQRGRDFRLHTTRGNFAAPALVVASGGLSIPSMGATGFGYELARAVRPRSAADARWAGAADAQRQASGTPGRSQRRRVAGEPRDATARSFSNYMLITHRGISGPAILQISSYLAAGRRPAPGPAAAARRAGRRCRQWQRERPAAELKTVLGDVMPKRFAQRLCELWLPNRPMKQFNAPQLREIAQVLQRLAAGRQRHRGLPHRRGDAGRRRHRRAVLQHDAVQARAGPVFHRRGRRRHRLARRLQLPVGVGVGACGGQRGLAEAWKQISPSPFVQSAAQRTKACSRAACLHALTPPHHAVRSLQKGTQGISPRINISPLG